MARQLNKLSARTVATATKPGRYGDGGGLALVVSADGRRRWVLRFTLGGKSQDNRFVPGPDGKPLTVTLDDVMKAGSTQASQNKSNTDAATSGTMTDLPGSGIANSIGQGIGDVLSRIGATPTTVPARAALLPAASSPMAASLTP